jgi:hypothetical protein
MASLEGLPVEEEAWVVRELANRPGATWADRWIAVDFQIRTNATTRQERVREALDRELKAGLDWTDRLELCRWLRKRGMAEESLRLLPPEMVATNQVVAQTWVEVLGELRRWGELERFASESIGQLDAVSADCAVALAATGLGDMEAAVRRLDTATRKCLGRPERLVQLAMFAEEIGHSDTAVLVWLEALRNPGVEAIAGPRLLRLIRSRPVTGVTRVIENVKVERSVYFALARVFGSEPVVQAQLAYLDALLGENLTETLHRIESLSAEAPGWVAVRAIHGLTELRLGRLEAALSRMEGGGVDWSVQEPRWRVVYASVLRANRLQDRARKAVAGLKLDPLRPLEQSQIADLLLPEAPAVPNSGAGSSQ